MLVKLDHSPTVWAENDKYLRRMIGAFQCNDLTMYFPSGLMMVYLITTHFVSFWFCCCFCNVILFLPSCQVSMHFTWGHLAKWTGFVLVVSLKVSCEGPKLLMWFCCFQVRIQNAQYFDNVIWANDIHGKSNHDSWWHNFGLTLCEAWAYQWKFSL